jgi:hypothetical protein
MEQKIQIIEILNTGAVATSQTVFSTEDLVATKEIDVFIC